MSGFVGFLRCILCCDDPTFEDTYRQTSIERSSAESPTHYTRDTRNYTPTYTYSKYPSAGFTKTTSDLENHPFLSTSSLSGKQAESPRRPISPPVQTKVVVEYAKNRSEQITVKKNSQETLSAKSSTSSLIPPYRPPKFSSQSSYTESSSSSLPPYSSSSTSSSPKPRPSPFKPSASSSTTSVQSSTEPPFSSSKLSRSLLHNPHPVSLKPPPVTRVSTTSYSSPSGSGSSVSSPVPPASSNTTLFEVSPNAKKADQRGKTEYVVVEKNSLPLYLIPEDIKDLIENDIVPEVLKKPLSPSTYRDYFAALLYAEDFYVEKWKDYELKDVNLNLQEASVYETGRRSNKKKYTDSEKNKKKKDKIFVEFEIDSIPERRPYLLSRDIVHARPCDRKVEQYQGFVYRVVKGNVVLVDFGKWFLAKHHSDRKYDISFSFNRVCLKRAHQAVEAASNNPFLQNFIFPDCNSRKNSQSPLYSQNSELDHDQHCAIRRILSLRGSPPYLLEGPPLCRNQWRRNPEIESEELSRTGVVIQEAVIQLYRNLPNGRILLCAPTNRTCDVLMRYLKKTVPERDMFRAVAAFREKLEVPDDILSSCIYDEECFLCPSLWELKQYKIVLSTFISSFRLYNEGLAAGYFTHIFLLDASSDIEPETLVPVANLANEDTAVIVTGETGNSSRWIRSDIGRRHGLKISYFERLGKRRQYMNLDPQFITQLWKDEADDDI